MPLCSGIATFAGLGDQVGATWAKSLTQSRSAWRKVVLTGRVGVKFGRSVRGALWELWKLLGNRRTSARNQITSEVKVYLSDEAYD